LTTVSSGFFGLGPDRGVGEESCSCMEGLRTTNKAYDAARIR
jgi:hypothetical protein